MITIPDLLLRNFLTAIDEVFIVINDKQLPPRCKRGG
jgi:hypothetical protein